MAIIHRQFATFTNTATVPKQTRRIKVIRPLATQNANKSNTKRAHAADGE